MLEQDLYEPIRRYLASLLQRSFDCYHLEVTANGAYSQRLRHFVRHDIVFSFLKMASPDLTGFVLKNGVDISLASSLDVESFITVEVKPTRITLQDIYQAKMYGDLFYAKYALLISPEIIGEEIRRLHERLRILNRFRDWKTYVGEVVIQDVQEVVVQDCIWHPETPF